MARLELGEPVDSRVPYVRKLRALEGARSIVGAAAKQRALEAAGLRLGDTLRSGPRVVSVRTLPTSDAPYPVRFAFNGAAPVPWPTALLLMKNRALLVQVQTELGLKNVLFNPTDGPTNLGTPFFARLADAIPALVRKRFMPKPNRCAEQLAALGLRCEDIDVIAFDHFHTQDLRPLIGAPGQPARFPNAYLLAPRSEWEQWDDLPDLQRAWYVPDGKRGVDMTRVILTDGDLSLGDGALLVRTPGHTPGNQTLFVHTERGVFGTSENGTTADNWTPHASRIPGVASAAKSLDLQVILNANTPESAIEQTQSMVLERAIVDRVPEHPEFCQMFPSSEVTWTPLAPHIRATHVFGAIESGEVQTRTVAAARPLAQSAE